MVETLFGDYESLAALLRAPQLKDVVTLVEQPGRPDLMVRLAQTETPERAQPAVREALRSLGETSTRRPSRARTLVRANSGPDDGRRPGSSRLSKRAAGADPGLGEPLMISTLCMCRGLQAQSGKKRRPPPSVPPRGGCARCVRDKRERLTDVGDEIFFAFVDGVL